MLITTAPTGSARMFKQASAYVDLLEHVVDIHPINIHSIVIIKSTGLSLINMFATCNQVAKTETGTFAFNLIYVCNT